MAISFVPGPERLLEASLWFVFGLFMLHSYFTWKSDPETQERLKKKSKDESQKKEEQFPIVKFFFLVVFAAVAWQYSGCLVCFLKDSFGVSNVKFDSFADFFSFVQESFAKFTTDFSKTGADFVENTVSNATATATMAPEPVAAAEPPVKQAVKKVAKKAAKTVAKAAVKAATGRSVEL